ncbi:RNA-binding S4 domain-containing protein [Candidatus Woesearchaeota archaeon]|nr:RNA-binding S4 domain-containing protein [Candidatus Woesearchaeota archaeon]
MGPFIELNVFLKKHNLASTGGQAKVIIQSGVVKVNNEVETRNRRKLHANDVVEFQNKKYTVAEELCR